MRDPCAVPLWRGLCDVFRHTRPSNRKLLYFEKRNIHNQRHFQLQPILRKYLDFTVAVLVHFVLVLFASRGDLLCNSSIYLKSCNLSICDLEIMNQRSSQILKNNMKLLVRESQLSHDFMLALSLNYYFFTSGCWEMIFSYKS